MSAYDEGSDAYFDGIPFDKNPYADSDEYDYSEWAYGWTTEFEIENETWDSDDDC